MFPISFCSESTVLLLFQRVAFHHHTWMKGWMMKFSFIAHKEVKQIWLWRLRPPREWKAASHHGSWLCPLNNANQSEVLGLVATERSWAVGCHHRDRLGRYCRENRQNTQRLNRYLISNKKKSGYLMRQSAGDAFHQKNTFWGMYWFTFFLRVQIDLNLMQSWSQDFMFVELNSTHLGFIGRIKTYIWISPTQQHHQWLINQWTSALTLPLQSVDSWTCSREKERDVLLNYILL